MEKLFLKDLVGQKNINIPVCVSIKGQKHDIPSLDDPRNVRILKEVYIKQEDGHDWLYVKWEPKGLLYWNDNTYSFNDCGFSGLKLGELHPLNNLYMIRP